jgi:hypothetical protein
MRGGSGTKYVDQMHDGYTFSQPRTSEKILYGPSDVWNR